MVTYYFPDKYYASDQAYWGLDLSKTPSIKVVGNTAKRFHAVIPMKIGKEENFELKLAALDEWGNADTSYKETVHFNSTDISAGLPANYTFTESDRGVHIFDNLTFKAQGLHKIMVDDGEIFGQTNYAMVKEGAPELNIFFGDTHGHSFFSDGNFFVEESYTYARDVAFLDFASITDHEDGYYGATGRIFPLENWQMLKDTAEEFYNPGKFMTFVASEESALKKTLSGHKNIYYLYNNEDAVIHTMDNPIELWMALRGTKAITIPHHTAASFGVGDFDKFDAEFERLVEVYSMHGSSEYYGNSFPLYSAADPYAGKYVQDALGPKKRRMGIIASSDTHFSPLGSLIPSTEHYVIKYGTGLAAIFASDLNRQKVFDGMYDRHTYGTSGERIFLEFQMDSHLMGEEYSIEANPKINVVAAGTKLLKKIEILKYSDSQGWQTIHTVDPNSEVAIFEYTDSNFVDDSLYYIRVTQADQEMAWSSPIWVEKLQENEIPHDQMSIVYADSEELIKTYHPATLAIDGDKNSFWHTQWYSANPIHPHEIQIDLKNIYELSQLSYLPRQDGSTNGRIKNYELYVSADGQTWEKINNGSFINSMAEQTINIANIPAKYVRLVALNEVLGNPWTSIAEISLKGTLSIPMPPDTAPPGIPLQLSASIVSCNQINLSWQASTDNVGVVGYKVFRDGAQIATTEQTGYSDAGLTGSTQYSYSVLAYDAAGNESEACEAIIAETSAAPFCGDGTCNAQETCSSCLEDCGVCPANPVEISKTGWSLKYVDSQEMTGTNGRAAYAFDNNPNTIWHTEWALTNPDPSHPHEIQIDLGAQYQLTQMRYLPRPGVYLNGTIKDYEFYVSLDGNNWTKIMSGTWAVNQLEKTVDFNSAQARYIRLRALSEAYGNPWTSAAEISLKGYEIN
ncbi:discoidin domain-containing protein [Candidatus Falkowbacteria bacterium]|nr:discoidin domain-containing protein [Candidatus Falkowbacteria bacterium]